MSAGQDGVKLLRGAAVAGVSARALRRIPDERGAVMHMLRRTDPHFVGFGEIYFSTVYQGVIKGWHRHLNKTINYACVHGRVKVALYDDRDDSPSKGSLMEVFLGPESYLLLTIPPGVWNGFKGLADNSIVANCASEPFDENMSQRLDPFDDRIPYDWSLKHG